MVLFVLFSTYSINLFYEWNPFLKKSFSFFYTYKNKSDFFKYINLIFFIF